MNDSVPDVSLPETPSTLDTVLAEAYEYFSAEKWAAAAAKLEFAIQLAPDAAQLHGALGIAQFRMSNFTEARSAFARALSISPNNPDIWVQQAITDLELGSLETAEESVKRALSISPSHPAANEKQGDLAAMRGAHENAAVAYSRVLTREPNRSDIYLKISASLAAIGDTEGAQAAEEEARRVSGEAKNNGSVQSTPASAMHVGTSQTLAPVSMPPHSRPGEAPPPREVPETVEHFEDLIWLFSADNRNRGIIRMNFDEAALLWRAVRSSSGAILEIGRRYGGSTCLLLAAAKQRDIYSIDIAPEHNASSNEFFQRTENKRRLHLIVGDSRLPIPGQSYGFALFDGDHSFRGLRDDVLAQWNALSTDGTALAAFHDAVPNDGLKHDDRANHCAGVKRVCDKLVAEGSGVFHASAGSMLVLRKVANIPATLFDGIEEPSESTPTAGSPSASSEGIDLHLNWLSAARVVGKAALHGSWVEFDGSNPASFSLPYPANSYPVVRCSGWENLNEQSATEFLTEVRRVCGTLLQVDASLTNARSRTWWETLLIAAGFRKSWRSPDPWAVSMTESGTELLEFEKIPDDALAIYPLSALKAERDLHMDMLRETGARSEAHLVRYQLAARCAKNGDVIVDAACGLGYGSAMLARMYPNSRVIGLDNSEYAIRYACANYASVLPNLEFHLADVCAPHVLGSTEIDLFISFETIEHVPDPRQLLASATLRMKPGSRFVGSVPNLWLDETGRDPNPWHFHVFDYPKFHQLCADFFNVTHVHRQNAGGWLRNPHASPQMVELNLPITDQLEEAEWWIITGEKAVRSAPGVTSKPRVWLIDGEPRAHFYNTLKERLDCDWLVGRDAVPGDIDLAIVSDEWWWKNSLLIQELKRRGTPTLHLMDGVIDWKNTWENPRSLDENTGMPLFQPVLSDKIACIGRSAERILSAWDNAEKCEVVGAPRFDRYYGVKRRSKPSNAPARLLVMTANTPYFNEEHRLDLLSSLRDLKDFFSTSAVEPVWRLTQGLEVELGVAPQAHECSGKDLLDVLLTVDAVVCTSSTAMLEAMMLGLPVALLDYSNVPHYLQPAWRITSPRQVCRTIRELITPPECKMLQQEMVLHDTLECSTPASERFAQLVCEMIREGREARQADRKPDFSKRLLPESRRPALKQNRFNLLKLYPDHSVFKMNKLVELQTELGHWRNSAGTTARQPNSATIEPSASAPAQPVPSAEGSVVKLHALARFVGDDWKNQPYYDEAEANLEKQWKGSVWPFIKDADFTTVLDLAAGHGRNSERLKQYAKKMYVVDINQENIDFCEKRFRGDPRFTFIRNDGCSLAGIPNDSITLAYCFDAMVHFDSDVVRAYLSEFRRVLRKGGLGFCHHSNFTGNPGGDVHNNRGWRNFMSQAQFLHYCAKEGLTVVQSKVIDWEFPQSDCLTLFKKT